MSLNFLRFSISMLLSRACSHIEGSSKTYIIPSSFVQICVARRILWASHHERVQAFLDIVMYSRPTPARNSRRSTAFFNTFFVIFLSDSLSSNVLKKSIAFSTDKFAKSPILYHCRETDNDSCFSRFPSHNGHSISTI
jgi:hypothetical protein